MVVKSKVKSDKVVETLQQHLSDLHMVYSHLHNFHWNMEGPHFFEYHSHLQGMYEDVAEKIDEVAERLLMLGERPLSNLTDYTEKSVLDPVMPKAFSVNEVGRYVLADLEALIISLRSGIESCQANEPSDEGTADFFIGMLRDHEKNRWLWSAAMGNAS